MNSYERLRWWVVPGYQAQLTTAEVFPAGELSGITKGGISLVTSYLNQCLNMQY
jgi:hypothetical protein